MRFLLRSFTCAALAALIAAGCGARSSLSSPTGDTGGGGGSTDLPDAGSPPDGGGPPDAPPGVCGASGPLPSSSCGPLSFFIGTKASCTMSLTPTAQLDAEGFMTAQQCDDCALSPNCNPSGDIPCTRVFTMTRFGQGHVIGWCDGTTLSQLVQAFDALPYLGRKTFPRVAMVGGSFPCPPVGPGVTDGEWLGDALPQKYVGNPGLLAEEWDVVVTCGAVGGGVGPWVPTLQSFVRDFGKGLLVSEDYKLSCPDSGPELTAVNALTSPAGFVFDPVQMDWADLTVDLPCVADYPL